MVKIFNYINSIDPDTLSVEDIYNFASCAKFSTHRLHFIFPNEFKPKNQNRFPEGVILLLEEATDEEIAATDLIEAFLKEVN